MGWHSISNQKSDDEIRIVRKVKEIKIAKSDYVNTWPFDLPVAVLQMQNRLVIGWKIMSCDHTLR